MKRGIIVLVAFLLLVSFASAIDTPIKINTLASHKLNLQFLNLEPPPIALDSVDLDSGESGVVDYVFSDSAEIFDLSVFLMDDSGTILHERFKGITAGKTVVINFVPGLVEIDKDYQENKVEKTEEVVETTATVENGAAEINDTENTVTETPQEVNSDADTENISDESPTGFSGFFKSIGFVSSGGGSFPLTKTFYYGGGAFLIGLILFFVYKPVRNRLKSSGGSKSQEIKEKEETLEEAKRKLKEMQERVEELSEEKQDKIKEVKKKLVEDEKELMRLRGEAKKDKD